MTPLYGILAAAKGAKRLRQAWEEKGFAAAVLFVFVVLVVAVLIMLVLGAYKFPL